MRREVVVTCERGSRFLNQRDSRRKDKERRTTHSRVHDELANAIRMDAAATVTATVPRIEDGELGDEATKTIASQKITSGEAC